MYKKHFVSVLTPSHSANDNSAMTEHKEIINADSYQQVLNFKN